MSLANTNIYRRMLRNCPRNLTFLWNNLTLKKQLETDLESAPKRNRPRLAKTAVFVNPWSPYVICLFSYFWRRRLRLIKTLNFLPPQNWSEPETVSPRYPRFLDPNFLEPSKRTPNLELFFCNIAKTRKVRKCRNTKFRVFDVSTKLHFFAVSVEPRYIHIVTHA